MIGRLVASFHARGLIGPAARAGVGFMRLRVHLEAGEAEFVADESGGRGQVAPQARGLGALGGDGALQGAVAHEHGPSAWLAEDDGAANGVGFDEALDGLSVDDFWLRGSDGHFSAMRSKCVMRDYLVCELESLE